MVAARRALRLRSRVPALVCVLALAGAIRAAAQGSEPLRKSDVIRLLSNPLIGAGEVADLIRRTCLAFRPTERDWADLRELGASADVLSSVGACAAREPRRATLASSAPPPPTPRAAPPPAAAAPPASSPPPMVVAALLAPRVVVGPGAVALVELQVKKSDGTDASGVKLVLRGSSEIPGGAARDVEAVADDSGFVSSPTP